MIVHSFRRQRLSLLILALLILAVQSAAVSQTQDSPVADAISKALEDPVLAHGLQGVLVESLRDGRVIYEKNSDLVFIPASNFKLLTSSAALDLLGPDYRFKTFLYLRGEQTPNGVLKGDIILQGRGDPVLRYETLSQMARRIRELGITVVEGRILGDDSWFDDVRLGWSWSWDDESYYYSAQISALNLNENVVDVWVKPGAKVGDPAVVEVSPPTPYLQVKNDARTDAAKAQKSLFIDRVRGRNIIRVTGSVALDYKPGSPEEAITVEDPTLFTVTRFKELLAAAGVQVRGDSARGAKPTDARFVMVHTSSPLSEILRLLNKPSDNLIAEVLFKTLGAERKGKGTSANAEQVELDYLKKIGGDLTAISISDGSGLSRSNYISPRNLVTILKYMHSHRNAKVFTDSLPIMGVDGTLRSRMKGTPAEGNVKAKTGYIGRVRTISGFATTKSGEPLVFSIMMNHHLCSSKEASAVQDKIILTLVNME